MKRINYGEMPTKEEFEEAYLNECEGKLFDISIPFDNPEHDVVTTAIEYMIAMGDVPNEDIPSPHNYENRGTKWYFNPSGLYTFVKILLDMSPSDVPTSEELDEEFWPINYATSVLYCLGFESM